MIETISSTYNLAAVPPVTSPCVNPTVDHTCLNDGNPVTKSLTVSFVSRNFYYSYANSGI